MSEEAVSQNPAETIIPCSSRWGPVCRMHSITLKVDILTLMSQIGPSVLQAFHHIESRHSDLDFPDRAQCGYMHSFTLKVDILTLMSQIGPSVLHAFHHIESRHSDLDVPDG